MVSVKALVPFLDTQENKTRGLLSTFVCDETRAAKLKKLGFVEFCDTSELVTVGKTSNTPAKPTKKSDDATEDDTTRAELVKQAEKLGINVPVKANKAKIRELIEKAQQQ